MYIIIPGMDMDSADKRATCARCKCVYEFSLDEAKFYRSVVDFCDDDTKKPLTSFSVVHMVAKCPNCGRMNLAENLFSNSYDDMIDSILRNLSVTYSDLSEEDLNG